MIKNQIQLKLKEQFTEQKSYDGKFNGQWLQIYNITRIYYYLFHHK